MKSGLAALFGTVLLLAAGGPALAVAGPPGDGPAGAGTGLPFPRREPLPSQLCLACHQGEGLTLEMEPGMVRLLDRIDPSAFEASVHAETGCVGCHPGQATLPHNEKAASARRPGSPLVDAVAVCSDCHRDAYEGYFHTAHGTVMNLDDRRAPNCVDCHGAHTVQAVADWSYPERGEMCARCHRGADASFARSAMGHREAAKDWFPETYFAGRFLIILTAGVLAIGVLHTELDILRWGIARASRLGRGRRQS